MMLIVGCSTTEKPHYEEPLPREVPAVCKEVLPAYDADPETISKVLTLFSDRADLVRGLREGWRPSGDYTRPARFPSPPLFLTPARAVREGKSGSSRVVLVVDNTGHVVEARLLSASDPAFEKATLEISSKWIFQPALQNARRIWSVVIASLEFPKE
ncbi:MAG: TonB family protein [Opitutaceae bacterium]|nr:TonB family protein [Opitutaceae bacterium]